MTNFVGTRARLYEEAIAEYPYARSQDIQIMKELLQPDQNDVILGAGEGNGFFAEEIAKLSKKYVVTDPSEDQLRNLQLRVKQKNVVVKKESLETLSKEEYTHKFNKIWSFGAFHHANNQELSMRNIFKALKRGGKLIICDVWRGTSLSEHFDKYVARYCCTGHDVKFLGDTYARTILEKAGFEESRIHFVDLYIKWQFNSELDLGKFIYKLHAMTLLKGSEEERFRKVFEGCKEILGVNKEGNKRFLNWPMKAIIAHK